ncbi:Holliday junction resolvase RuvX [Helicobacter sp. MIT 14-3879]|uniref:Holliday junction resolvase RuvX n=1 Tax=Helicobacter sp. MIT 14-3879 TaxID=2040649 RepID=UPI000E1E38B8|nr:Holliday junction resolvase RuvX [Helicobacter sp. MIT 14-3879]RDU64640.1 Holliday junction resolvase RuvX [Helicobacter sp. MIT 14-3879]
MLAIDFGLKRIGIAWNCHKIILPLPAIINDSNASNKLKIIIEQKNIKTLLIGLVKDEIMANLNDFIAQAKFSGEIIFIDETLSTKEAENHIQGRSNSKKLRKNGTLDSLSAMIILERYLNL